MLASRHSSSSSSTSSNAEGDNRTASLERNKGDGSRRKKVEKWLRRRKQIENHRSFAEKYNSFEDGPMSLHDSTITPPTNNMDNADSAGISRHGGGRHNWSGGGSHGGGGGGTHGGGGTQKSVDSSTLPRSGHSTSKNVESSTLPRGHNAPRSHDSSTLPRTHNSLPPKNPPANALTSALPPKQNSLTNGNKSFTNDKSVEVDDSLKEAPLEETLEQVKVLVHQLRQLEEYHRGDGMQVQKALGDFYWKKIKHRKEIGNLMCKEGYAETSVKMLKTLNTMGIFKNDDIWFPTYYAYNTMWNFSDASDELAKALADADVVRLLSLNCGHKPYINAIHSKNVYYVIKASLSILHNIARNPDVKHYFKEHKTSEVVKPFIENSDEMLKALAMLTLAYVVDEDENSSLIDETGVIKCVCEWLKKALASPKRRYRGFTPQELAQGLDKLAVNDTNKSKIEEEGALHSFLYMIQHDDVREQSMAARAIWTLSFDKNVRLKISEMTELIEMLEKLTQSADDSLSKSCIGALWIIREEADNPNRPRSGAPSKSHVFISYSWSDSDLVNEIADKLKAEGYNIWIDIEQMGGCTLQAMAEAVENAAVVLICMSEKYKQSPNCRTEAEYTFQLRKDYIPLMMQKRFRPDGWLGLILGAKLYIDFSGKFPFDKSSNGLLKELRGRGKGVANGPKRIESIDVSAVHSAPTVNHSHNQSHHPHHNSPPQIKTREEVGRWLQHVGLGHLHASFSSIDGRMLGQIREMRREAPEFFYQSLERRLGMSFADILLFTDALDGLTT